MQQIFRNKILLTEEEKRLDPDAPDFDIGILVGNNKFKFMKLLQMGKIKQIPKTIQLSGQVVDFAVDQQNDTGFYFIEESLRQSSLPKISDTDSNQGLEYKTKKL